MGWLLLTILAIVARAIFSIATKLLSKHVEVSAVTHAVLLTVSAGLLAIPVTPFIGGISFEGLDQYWLAAFLVAGAQAFGGLLFFAGVKRLDTGMAQIAFSSILIWGTLLSVIFLDSAFSGTQSVGIVVMLLAILIAQYKKGKKRLDAGVVYIVAAAALLAVFQVASADLAEAISTGAYLMLAFFGSSALLGLIYFRTLKKDWSHLKHQVRNTSKSTLFAGGASLLYFMLSYLAYQAAPDRGVVVVLLTAQVVLSVILGVIFLGEKDNLLRKLVAGVLAFVAGALIRN